MFHGNGIEIKSPFPYCTPLGSLGSIKEKNYEAIVYAVKKPLCRIKRFCGYVMLHISGK